MATEKMDFRFYRVIWYCSGHEKTRLDCGLTPAILIQAEKELDGSGIKLHKLRIPGAVDYPQWLAEVLESGTKVGIDGFCMSVSDVM